MLISFFEEYPASKNLAKLKLVKFPTKLYIAAASFEDFIKIKSKITSKYVKEIVYWPVLSDDEGYWLSPFSKRNALLRVMNESEDVDILWDAEFPKRRRLLFTQCFRFLGNKFLISLFFRNRKRRIYTAEYFPESGFFAFMLRLLGLSFSPLKFRNCQVKMLYSSMHEYGEKFMRKEMENGARSFGKDFAVGLGVIAKGKRGDEKLLPAEILKRDLRIARESGVSEAIVFRLGGLDKKHIDAILNYQ